MVVFVMIRGDEPVGAVARGARGGGGGGGGGRKAGGGVRADDEATGTPAVATRDGTGSEREGVRD